MSDIERFKLNQSDGELCAQVHILDDADLEYWQSEAEKTGHLIAFDYHVPADYSTNIYGISFDVYQIYPPEVSNKIFLHRIAGGGEA